MAVVEQRNAVWICLIFATSWGCSSAPKPSEDGSGGARAPQPVSSASGAARTQAADKRALIVTFGDSLSAGYGADPGKSYPDFLQKRIDGAHLSYRVYNAGVSGDTTTDGLERMPPVIAMKPKIVILELGGNDGLRGLPPALTEQNLATMIRAFQGGGATVILAGITLPRNYGLDYIDQFDQIYVRLAQRFHVHLIPFLLADVATNPKLMQQDGIHPTAEGNKIVADHVFAAVKPELRPAKR